MLYAITNRKVYPGSRCRYLVSAIRKFKEKKKSCIMGLYDITLKILLLKEYEIQEQSVQPV